MSDPACYGRLLSPQKGHPPQIAIAASEEAAIERAVQRPAEIDAVLVFDQGRGGGDGKRARRDTHKDEDVSPPSLASELYGYRIRMNHTDMPIPEVCFFLCVSVTTCICLYASLCVHPCALRVSVSVPVPMS